MTEFDYIIVGGGAAGCVLAYRLSANPDTHVLLIEAGGSGRHPVIDTPKGIAKAMSDPAFIWPYMTLPERASNNAAESWARGRVLGGSSAVNGMVYVRGHASDFTALGELAGSGWNWDQIGRAYREIEAHELGEAATRGARGPLRISMPTFRGPLLEAAIAAGEAAGLKRVIDVNSPEDIDRIGYAPRTIYRGRRQSAATAFLDPVRSRRNLTIATGLRVNRIAFESRRAAEVMCSRNTSEIAYRAKREIILCAGTLSTPAILQRSGIGPRDHLREMGIPVVSESPEVGENLHEHRGMVMQWHIKEEFSQNREYRAPRLWGNVLRYALTRSGPMSSGAYDLGAWFRTGPEETRPDAQILIAPFTFDYASPTFAVESGGGMNFCVYPLRPSSTGKLRIRSADPSALPQIQSNYSDTEIDRQRMAGAIRFARRLAAQKPLSEIVIAETRPGPAYQSDDELAEAHRLFGYGSYHACGSCRMGADNASVVDPELRVRGVEGLRVADTSIMPFILSGNTNGPAMAMAWRAAEIIEGGIHAGSAGA